MISPDQAALDPARAAAWAALAHSDFSILAIVCGRFRPDIGSRSRLPMPSPQPIIHAMTEVNKELQVRTVVHGDDFVSEGHVIFNAACELSLIHI